MKLMIKKIRGNKKRVKQKFKKNLKKKYGDKKQ